MKKRDFIKTGLLLAAGSITSISKANVAVRSNSGIKGLRTVMPDYYSSNVANLFSQEAFNAHVKSYQKTAKQIESDLNNLVFKPENIKSVLLNNNSYNTALVNKTSCYHNHKLFFKQFENNIQKNSTSCTIVNDIEKKFGSTDNLKRALKNAASKLNNEGWAWLVSNNNSIEVVVTNDNNTPISDKNNSGFPLIVVDLHKDSYAKDYGQDISSYIDNLVDAINWDYIETRYKKVPARII